MGLFSRKPKEDEYSINTLFLPITFDTIVKMFSNSVMNSGHRVTKSIELYNDAGTIFAHGKINDDVTIVILLLDEAEYDYEIFIRRPETSATVEADIKEIVVNYLKDYVAAFPEVEPYQYFASKGKLSWEEVHEIVGKDEFIMESRRRMPD